MLAASQAIALVLLAGKLGMPMMYPGVAGLPDGRFDGPFTVVEKTVTGLY
jgi:hypothetical protein